MPTHINDPPWEVIPNNPTVNYNHRLYPTLKRLWVAGYRHDLITGESLSYTSEPELEAGKYGPMARFSFSDSLIYSSPSIGIGNNLQDGAVFAMLAPGDEADRLSYSNYYCYLSISNNDNINWERQGFNIDVGSGSGFSSLDSYDKEDFVPYNSAVICAVVRGDQWRLYQNGELWWETAIAGWRREFRYDRIGHELVGGRLGFLGYGLNWSYDDAREFTERPHELFRPRSSVSTFYVASPPPISALSRRATRTIQPGLLPG